MRRKQQPPADGVGPRQWRHELTLSSWNNGISPYDFDLPFGRDDGGEIIHTIFDRALVRVGETVHFKHVLRRKVGNGFAYADGVKGKFVLRHMGSKPASPCRFPSAPRALARANGKCPGRAAGRLRAGFRRGRAQFLDQSKHPGR
jgi:hypothetical protein